MGEAHDTSSGPADLGADTLSDALPLRRSQLVERGTAIGRYVVIESVGSGGMSTVYAAYDPELDRRVALKVMRATSDDSEKVRETERSRLLREAQAMARLSHPNVVTVHDVGTFGDRVFLAMHFVDGETLTTWVRHAKSWREIVEMYGYAGRGLAAAHKVGLVHRDFKPDNVLVDGDRRVRVTDFGLARPVATALASESSSGAPVDILTSSSRLEKPITLAGSIMGTPAYMAPEQYLGQTVDARSDQFSFCVALWEALNGERPFPGETLGEVAHSVTRGNIRTFPQKSPVTARVRRALERGLRRRPEERFADVEELLRELAPPSRRRPLLVAGIAVGLVGVGAMVPMLSSSNDDDALCGGATSAFADTWSDARRTAVKDVLTRELDDGAGNRALAVIDGYAERWRASAIDACVQNKVTAAQSDSAFDARSRCLQRRRAQLDMQLQRIEQGTAASITAAVQGLHALVQPEVCNDAEVLAQTVPPPDDPSTRAAIDELYARAVALDVSINVTTDADHRAQVDAVLDEARRLGWPPMTAKALWIDAQLRGVVGDAVGAEQALYAMTLAAATGRDSEQLIQAWILLTYEVGHAQGRVAEGLQLARMGEVEIARAGYPYDTIRLLTHKGAVYQAGNDRVHARESWQLAITMLEAEPDARPHVRAVLLNNLGTLDLAEGDTLAALARFREARDIAADLFGAQSPWLADNYLNMCLAHTVRGAFEEANTECEHALALLQGPDADKAAIARVLQGLVMPSIGMGRLAEARRLAERARAALRDAYGDGSYAIAAGEISMAQAELYSGNPEQARAHAIAGEEILRALGPAFDSSRGDAQTVLGIIAFGEGDLVTALARCSEAVELNEAGLGRDHPTLVESLACKGSALVGLGRPREARSLLERALAIRARSGGDALAASHARLALAEAELATGGDHDKARTLVLAARRDLDPVNPRVERYAKELDAWLEDHR